MNPQESSSDQFSGRMGLISATIGAAIGTATVGAYHPREAPDVTGSYGSADGGEDQPHTAAELVR
jgi:hypothetical protein